MKFTKKTLGVLALSVALAVPALAYLGVSSTNNVSASAVTSDAHLTDEQVFADAYKGLTAAEVKTYVDYIDEREKLNADMTKLLAADDGEVTDKTEKQYNEILSKIDRIDNEMFLLEKTSWVVEEKERINGFVNVDDFVKKGLTDRLTSILDLETKLAKSGLSSDEKKTLSSEYREYTATISYFDTITEVEATNLSDDEKAKLLEARLKVNELNREIANLEYDESLEVVEKDKAKNDAYEAEINSLYKDVIKPLHDKAGLDTPTKDLVW